jgi:glycosyltransferase involved in cell wall biosynthesis
VTGRDRSPSDGPTTVVHLITTLTQGGAERVLSQVVPRPADRPEERHVVVSLVDGGMFADELVAAGVEVRGLGMRPGRDVLRGARRLGALLRELRPTLVVSWMYHACLLNLLARPFAGERRRARMVWFLRGSLHSLDGLPLHTRATVRLLALLSRVPEAVAINSRTGRRHHVRAGYRPRRWVLLPNGCDTERFRSDPGDRRAVRDELGVPDGVALALFVGRAHTEKGIDVLLEATSMLAADVPLRLVLLGAGTEHLTSDAGSSLQPLVTGLGVRHDVERMLRGADLLVLPSRTEGTPNALIEAMATEVPCVVTDVGDCAELVGPAGLVVPSEAPVELAAALRTMVSTDAEERRRLGAAGRARILARHALPVARAQYWDLWSESPR